MSALTPRDYEYFLLLKISSDIVDAARISRITKFEAEEHHGIKIHGDHGLLFPHFLPPVNSYVDAHPASYTVRDLNPHYDAAGKAERKYVSSPGRQYPYTVPVDPLRYQDRSVPVILVEAQKSALSLWRWSDDHNWRMVPVAIAGCYGWRGVTGITTDENGQRVKVKGLNPTLASICCGHRVYILLDQNAATNPHVQHGRAWLANTLLDEKVTNDVRILELPPSITAPFWNGPDDFIALCGDEALHDVFEGARRWEPNTSKGAFHRTRDLASGPNPWSRAEGLAVFLEGEEQPVDFLYSPLIVRGAVAEIFSPRGIGKTMWGLFVAVKLARKGYRVLLIDRDNPRRVVQARLRSFGATNELPLKVISREYAPKLTDAQAWAEFPYSEYDLVIVDSLDSAAEGIGEQDSAKPSKAIAPLLDIAHRENGPAVLVLGNCVRTGAHSRGSGVIEDRADIVCEVRDCTNFHPSGKRPWVEELPPADAGSWASRSSRRKLQVQFRLAFIPTKFRVGEEPEPFINQLNLADEPWTVEDVTDLVDLEGKAERERLERAAAERTEHARTALLEEINRRVEASEPPLYKDRDAIPLLQKNGLTQKQSRQVIKASGGSTWRLVPLAGVHGTPVAVLPLAYDFVANGGYIKVSDDGKTTPQKPAKNGPFESSSFRWPLPEHPTERVPSQPNETKSVTTPSLSVAGSNDKGGGGAKPGAEEEL